MVKAGCVLQVWVGEAPHGGKVIAFDLNSGASDLAVERDDDDDGDDGDDVDVTQ